MAYKYIIEDKSDLVKRLVGILRDHSVSKTCKYVGNNIEVYSTDDKMTEVIVCWSDRSITVHTERHCSL